MACLCPPPRSPTPWYDLMFCIWNSGGLWFVTDSASTLSDEGGMGSKWEGGGGAGALDYLHVPPVPRQPFRLLGACRVACSLKVT